MELVRNWDFHGSKPDSTKGIYYYFRDLVVLILDITNYSKYTPPIYAVKAKRKSLEILCFKLLASFNFQIKESIRGTVRVLIKVVIIMVNACGNGP